MKKLFQFTLILITMSLIAQDISAQIATSGPLKSKGAQYDGHGPRLAEDSNAQGLSETIDPIEIIVITNSIEYTFNELLGLVTVKLTSESGLVVYSQVVNSQIISSGSIDISNASSGNYVLEFITSDKRKSCYADITIR